MRLSKIKGVPVLAVLILSSFPLREANAQDRSTLWEPIARATDLIVEESLRNWGDVSEATEKRLQAAIDGVGDLVKKAPPVEVKKLGLDLALFSGDRWRDLLDPLFFDGIRDAPKPEDKWRAFDAVWKFRSKLLGRIVDGDPTTQIAKRILILEKSADMKLALVEANRTRMESVYRGIVAQGEPRDVAAAFEAAMLNCLYFSDYSTAQALIDIVLSRASSGQIGEREAASILSSHLGDIESSVYSRDNSAFTFKKRLDRDAPRLRELKVTASLKLMKTLLARPTHVDPAVLAKIASDLPKKLVTPTAILNDVPVDPKLLVEVWGGLCLKYKSTFFREKPSGGGWYVDKRVLPIEPFLKYLESKKETLTFDQLAEMAYRYAMTVEKGDFERNLAAETFLEKEFYTYSNIDPEVPENRIPADERSIRKLASITADPDMARRLQWAALHGLDKPARQGKLPPAIVEEIARQFASSTVAEVKANAQSIVVNHAASRTHTGRGSHLVHRPPTGDERLDPSREGEGRSRPRDARGYRPERRVREIRR